MFSTPVSVDEQDPLLPRDTWVAETPEVVRLLVFVPRLEDFA